MNKYLLTFKNGCLTDFKKLTEDQVVVDEKDLGETLIKNFNCNKSTPPEIVYCGDITNTRGSKLTCKLTGGVDIRPRPEEKYK